ncbi:MAG TPA: DUF2911 domain-containing protein [Chitinophagaceae bacterium]|jgi:hypothetical protein|nr:DUF2911 domain-containing protein [Chitinophagaceae bacterium]
MKKLVMMFFSLSLFFSAAVAQSNGSKFPVLDKSPMDMAYYPANYPVLKIQDKASEPLVARIIYSRPQKNNRTVYGELVEFNQVWRLGANEATEVEFYRDVKIAGKKVPKGKYTLYAVVGQNDWTMIVNKETDTWGAFRYDEKKDVVRVNVPAQKINEAVDAFTMFFDKTSNGVNLNVAWDTVQVSLPIQLK